MVLVVNCLLFLVIFTAEALLCSFRKAEQVRLTLRGAAELLALIFQKSINVILTMAFLLFFVPFSASYIF